MTDIPNPLVEDQLLPEIVNGVVTYFRRETHRDERGMVTRRELLVCAQASHPALPADQDIKQGVFVTTCPISPEEFMALRVSVAQNIVHTLAFIDENGIEAYNARVRTKD